MLEIIVSLDHMIICGMDECGRGPLAGPLVAAAVVLTKPVPGLADSKQLTAQKRQVLYQQIQLSGAQIAIEQVSVTHINRRGVGWANKIVFKRLAKKMAADHYIADGNLKLGKRIQSVVKADATVPEVMAASIVAKVWRDQLMDKLHHRYCHYDWQKNKGYGTRHHLEALRTHGPCRHHRTLFVTTALKLP